MDPQPLPQSTNIPVEPPPQSAPPPVKKNPWTTIGIMLVLLVGIAIGVILSNKSLLLQFIQLGSSPTPTPTTIPSPTPTTNPTTTWKTYTDPKYNFSFKYPSESQIQTQQGGQVYDFEVFISNLAKDIDHAGTNIRLWVIESTKSSYTDLAKSFHNHDSKWMDNPSQRYSDMQNTNIVGTPAITFNTSICPQQPGTVFYCEQTEYYFLNDGKVNYLISTTHPIDQKQQSLNKNLVDQILSTFKFSGQPTASNLKTYDDPILDLSFQYPSTWKLTTGSYGGDIALDGTGACDYINKSFSGYLKNPNSCADTTIKSFSPGLTLTSPDGVSNLGFTGPTSGLGGACPECVPNSPKVITITGKSYTLNTYTRPDANIKFSSLFPDQVGILAGAKSVWNKFDIDLNAVDQATFDTEIGILQSITYTH